MLNKQNIWFMTLFSFILVLGVYYVTMPNDILKDVNIRTEEMVETLQEDVENPSSLTVLRVNKEEKRKEKMDALETSLIRDNLTTEEKNNTFELLKHMTQLQGKEESLEKKLQKDLGLDCYVQIDQLNVSTVCIAKEHNKSLANTIMRKIQEEYKERMTIQVKFQNK